VSVEQVGSDKKEKKVGDLGHAEVWDGYNISLIILIPSAPAHTILRLVRLASPHLRCEGLEDNWYEGDVQHQTNQLILR
jgi:hypothetical protein